MGPSSSRGALDPDRVVEIADAEGKREGAVAFSLLSDDGRLDDRATSFGGVADAYDEFRPRPPQALASLLNPIRGRLALDLAAGTGKMARFLSALGARVVAIDLDLRMAGLIAGDDGGIAVAIGRAEAIPCRSGSIDVVTVSSAWHWFDHGRAVPEISRVLAPGGRLFILGNGIHYGGGGWVRSIGEARRELLGDRHAPRHHDDADDWRGSDLGERRRTTLEWSWSRSLDQFLGLLGTYSHVFVNEPHAVASFFERAREIATEHSVNGQIEVPMACRVVEVTKE